MLPSLFSVDMARWQFAVSASYHFLFVPLTLGLTWMVFTMELAYVLTRKEVYKDMTRFWGKLLGINFALGVLTGLTMEFQFGTNWAYYSQFVGDIFGTPLAIEGLVAFMLESTFFGLFFFGWDKLSKKQHLFATFCLAIGSSLSALLILVANGFMQNPVGAYFNVDTMRMQTSSLLDVFMNPFAQIGFAHTILAGYTTGAVFVLGISSYYLLRGRDIEFAKCSFAIASGFGIVASLMVLMMGDKSGLMVYQHQPLKLAVIEAEWNTEKAPASFNLIAFPSQQEQKNNFAIEIPDILGLIVTHNWTQQITGIKDLVKDNEVRITNGQIAYADLLKIRGGDKSTATMDEFNQYKNDLGFGMLLTNYTSDITTATPEQVTEAANATLPNVASVFWAFRFMVGFGALITLMFIASFFLSIFSRQWKQNWFYRLALLSIPLPIIATICGWIVTEHGRQPWTIYNVLPTPLSSSSIAGGDVIASFILFSLFYTLLFVVEIYLMFKFARLGPSALHLGRYHFEKSHSPEEK
ncbi:MAG: cytochrome BD oxidase subunit I [Legionellales bacterium]|nr:cytochrome BD oxidase subunit I [Legionellales bacterium]